MTCLLLNMETDLSDPCVMFAKDRTDAIGQLNALPHRVGWVLSNDTDLTRPADFAPEILGLVKLRPKDLISVYNAFAPKPVSRFESQSAGARRTAQLLLTKFGIVNNEVKMSESHEVQNTALQDAALEGMANQPETDHEDTEFVLEPGVRVTLLPGTTSKGIPIPEEHGVVLEVTDEGVKVRLDPLYWANAEDNGERDVEAYECGPDPLGEVRQKPEPKKTKKQIQAEERAKRAANRAAKAQEKANVAAAEAAEKQAAAEAKEAEAKAKAEEAARKAAEAKPAKPVLADEVAKGGMVSDIAKAADVPEAKIVRALHKALKDNPSVYLHISDDDEFVITMKRSDVNFDTRSTGTTRSTGNGAPRRSKNTELDEAAARGEMPEKPVVTSVTNAHRQKHFDRLYEAAEAGEWDKVAAFNMKGIDTYSKSINRYRDRLLTAHQVQLQQATA